MHGCEDWLCYQLTLGREVAESVVHLKSKENKRTNRRGEITLSFCLLTLGPVLSIFNDLLCRGRHSAMWEAFSLQTLKIKVLPSYNPFLWGRRVFWSGRLGISHPFSVGPETITLSTFDTYCLPSRADLWSETWHPSTFLPFRLLFLAAFPTQLPARLEEAKQHEWRVRRRHQRQPDGPEVSPPPVILLPLLWHH